MQILLIVASLAPCLVHANTPGNEANGFGSGFTAIAKDLQDLGHEDIDIERNISAEADTEATLNLEKLQVHDKLENMKVEDAHLKAALTRSKHSMAHVQKNYQQALSVIKNKYEAQIKAMLPRLETCGKQRDQLASELNVASAELYMAQEKLQEAREEVNATKKNWTNLVGDLAKTVDEDEQRIVALRANVSQNQNDTRRTLLAASSMNDEEQQLQQVVANATEKVQAAKDEAAHLSESIRQAQHEGVELTKKSVDLGSRTKQLLKRIKDQVHVEQTTKNVHEASKKASDVQKSDLQEMIASRKARITVTHAETDKAVKDLDDANDLLAKNKEVIARFENRTAAEKAHATAECNHEIAQVKEESGQRVAAMQVALDQARHAEEKIVEQNHQLKAQVEALKLQIAHSFVQFE